VVYLVILLRLHVYLGSSDFVENDRLHSQLSHISLAHGLSRIPPISTSDTPTSNIFIGLDIQLSFYLVTFFEDIFNLTPSFGVRWVLVLVHDF